MSDERKRGPQAWWLYVAAVAMLTISLFSLIFFPVFSSAIPTTTSVIWSRVVAVASLAACGFAFSIWLEIKNN